MTTEQDRAAWKPPPAGTPCWIQIMATDVERASKFYASVFNWKLRPGGNEQLIHFQTPGTGECPDGGFTKVSEADFQRSSGHGGVALYLVVDDLESSAAKIIKAGGKQMSEITPEGELSSQQTFLDTEGNFFGIYEFMQQKKQK